MIEIFNILFFLFTFPLLFFFHSFKKDIDLFYFIRNITIGIILLSNIFLFFFILNIKFDYIKYIVVFLLVYNLLFILQFYKNKHLYFFLFINLIFFIKISAEPYLEWDGLSIWYEKALIFQQNGSILDLKNTNNPFYPFLGPILWSIFWKLSFVDNEYFGRLIYIFIYLTSLFGILSYSKKISIKDYVLLFLILFFSSDFFLFRGYQEYLIFSFLNIFIVLYCNEKKDYKLFLISLLLINLILWSKSEGLIFSIGILYLIFAKKDLNFTQKILFLLLTFFFLFIKFLVLRNITGSYALYGGFHFKDSLLLLPNFNTFFLSSYLILKHMIIGFFKYPVWLLIIFYLALPKNKLINETLIKNFRILFLIKFFLIFIIFYILGHKNVNTLEWLLSNALDRHLLMLSGFFIYYLYVNLKSTFSKIKI